MNLFVALTGALFLATSLAILVSPGSGRWSLENLITRGMMPVFSIVRIGIGIVFVLAAPSTRLPGFVWALGLLSIFSGIALPILGFDRLKKYTDWWLVKPDTAFRGWSLLGILLGALLLWAGT
ncbi:MAG: hypothetical protein KJO06_04205 [Gemmatimonadetes bacterium]|nr:hypothetical protein [Gemmatimonadota bacterium]